MYYTVMKVKILLFLFLLFSMGCGSMNVIKHFKPNEHLPQPPKVSAEEAFNYVDSNNDNTISKEEFAAEDITVAAKPAIQEIDGETPLIIFLWLMGGTCLLLAVLKIKPISSAASKASMKICEASFDGLTVIKAKFNGLRKKGILPSKERVEDAE